MQMAGKCIEDYISHCNEKSISVKAYYQRMLDIIQGKAIENTSSKDYLIAKAFLNNPQKALCAIDSPSCFNCDDCALSSGCRYPLLKEIEDISQKAMKEYMPDQNSLKELFS